jgi:hypothetical protein
MQANALEIANRKGQYDRQGSTGYNSTYPKGGVSYSKDPDASGWLIIRLGGF